MRPRSSRDDLETFLRDLDTRLERLERHTHNHQQGNAPSGDYGNHARFGSDDLIYARKIAYSDTQPTADDFASDTIPFGVIWISTEPDPEPALNLVQAWNGDIWTGRRPARAYMPEGWVQATAVYTWDGYQWVPPP